VLDLARKIPPAMADNSSKEKGEEKRKD